MAGAGVQRGDGAGGFTELTGLAEGARWEVKTTHYQTARFICLGVWSFKRSFKRIL